MIFTTNLLFKWRAEYLFLGGIERVAILVIIIKVVASLEQDRIICLILNMWKGAIRSAASRFGQPVVGRQAKQNNE